MLLGSKPWGSAVERLRSQRYDARLRCTSEKVFAETNVQIFQIQVDLQKNVIGQKTSKMYLKGYQKIRVTSQQHMLHWLVVGDHWFIERAVQLQVIAIQSHSENDKSSFSPAHIPFALVIRHACKGLSRLLRIVTCFFLHSRNEFQVRKIPLCHR